MGRGRGPHLNALSKKEGKSQHVIPEEGQPCHSGPPSGAAALQSTPLPSPVAVGGLPHAPHTLGFFLFSWYMMGRYVSSQITAFKSK